jgi:predicted MFS family arabinose efflux permease
VLAAIQALLTVPAHAIVLRSAPRGTTTPSVAPGSPRAVLADRGFWLLTLAFTANTAAIATVSVHLVAALITWGHSPAFAATTAGLFGILSVTGRLITTGLWRRFRTTTVVAAIFAVQGAAAAALPVVGHRALPAVAAVTGFGIGFGVGSIARPALLADRYDTRRYATIAGLLVVPMSIAKATAPLAAAYLRTATHGYGTVFAATAAACLVSAAALTARTGSMAPDRTGASRDTDG